MSKNQSFLVFWAYIGLRALILMIAFWEILIELGQLVGQKLGRKHNKKKPLDFLHTFRHICYFVGELCIIDHHKTKKLKKQTKEKSKTHKQTSDHTNKQTNKQRNPHCFCFDDAPRDV